MSQSQNIAPRADASLGVAPTPQNTPLDTAVLSNRPATIGKTTMEEIGEGEGDDDEDAEDAVPMNPASLLASNPALLALTQAKFDALIGRSSGYIESLPTAVRRRIDGLKGVQVEHSKIESEFQMAILELEKKFLEKYAPLYDRRLAIITGKAEPTDAEVEAGKKADEDEEDEDEEEGAKIEEVEDKKEDEEELTGVPEFWLTALKNHAAIADTISDRDEEVLKLLTDIRLSYPEGGQPGFRLHFTFAPNDFFEDSELTKTYYYQEEVGYGGDFVYDKAIGHDIKWKEEKDLTKKIEIKKQRNKTTGRTRVIKKNVPTESFFNFFYPPQPPTEEALENEDLDEDEMDELNTKLEMDYQFGEDFKEKIIPRAVDYFTGKALRYEDDFDEELEEDFEDDDDEEDEEDDE